MRWKIILVNGGIVLVLSLLTFFLLRSSLETVVANQSEQRRELARALQSADARLSLDALRMEQWLARQAQGATVRSVFEGGTATARSEAATAEANRLRDRAIADAEFAKMAPSLVLFVDREGLGLGRNGSELMRGDKVGEAYPSLRSAIEQGHSASDIWISPARQEQMLVAYAPVLAGDQVVGAVVLGTPLNDERLKRTSELTSGRPLGLVVGEGGSLVAVGGGTRTGFQDAAVRAAAEAARTGSLSYARGDLVSGEIYAAIRLSGYETAEAVLVGSIPASRVASIESLLWPVFAIGALGIFLVVAGGVMLGNYISRPVAEIEEGLLLVMNGQQDLRFDLEHDELGGLTSRINGLLNTLLGVPEEDSTPENRS